MLYKYSRPKERGLVFHTRALRSHAMALSCARALSLAGSARRIPSGSPTAPGAAGQTPACVVPRLRRRHISTAAASSTYTPTHRVSELQSEGAYAVLAAANALEATGRDIVHLEIGQPGFPSPPHVVDAGVAAIKGGQTKCVVERSPRPLFPSSSHPSIRAHAGTVDRVGRTLFDTFPMPAPLTCRSPSSTYVVYVRRLPSTRRYSAPDGTPGLRDAIARYVTRTRGVDVAPDEVVVGPGAKPGLFFPALALLNPGDEVVYPDPGFPTYKAMIQVAGGVGVPVPLRPDGASFDMDAMRAAVTEKTKLIVLNSPANPTGGVMPAEDVETIAQLAMENDAWVLTDEIYSRLVYPEGGGEAPSVFALPGMKERTILVDGFSKTYCMTGWRLGWAVMPVPLARKVELLIVHSVGCTATFTQAAGVAALEGPQDSVDAMREEYQQRRDFVVGALNDIPGVTCPVPAGAFYAFPDVSAFGMSSKEVADLLLEEGGVAVLPGTDFGANGEGKIRLSYVGDMTVLEEGMKRISETLGKLKVV